MTAPGLWVLGGRDASIPTPQTRAILDEIAAERPGMIDVVVHEDAGHDIAHHLYQDEVVDRLSSKLGTTSAD
jgi:esterase/lipase